MRRYVLCASFVAALCLGCGNPSPPSVSQKGSEDPELQAREVLEKMFATYQTCRSYADNAVYRERWVLRQDGVLQEPPPQMISVSFERPAKLRITRRLPDSAGNVAEEILLISTGSRMFHALPNYPGQVLATVAPIELNADNFAAAPQVAESLLVLPREDCLPQLDMLLAERPQAEALEEGGPPELLEDAVLGDRVCYRVALSGNSGRRVYWIDKQSHLLARLDLPPGEIRESVDPHDRLQGFERWIELSDAVVNRELPPQAFQVEVPDDSVVVREWVPGYPGPEPAGPGITAEQKQRYDAEMAAYEAALAAAAAEQSRWQVEMEETPVSARTEPESLRLVEEWAVAGLKNPGNMVAFGDAEEQRIFVIDAGTSVVELDLKNQTTTRHSLDGLQGELVGLLRTCTDADENLWFATTGRGLQRVHLFDDAWNHRWSFPDDKHYGIGDILFAPLSPQSDPQVIVGFWSDLSAAPTGLGIHGVALDGSRVWVDRSVPQILALAEVDPDNGTPVVWSATGGELIGRVGKDGPLAPLQLSGRALVELACSDLDGDGESERCGVAFSEIGVYDVVGIDANGREQWSYRLPQGEIHTGTERISASKGDFLRAWVLPAADGSIHFLRGDGELVDRFNYGAPITGILSTVDAGKTLLAVATAGGLKIWRVEAIQEHRSSAQGSGQ